MGFKDIGYMTFSCIKCEIHKYTNKKCLKDPTCAIFLKSMGFKDIKYDIPVCVSNVKYTNTQIRNAQIQRAQKTLHIFEKHGIQGYQI